MKCRAALVFTCIGLAMWEPLSLAQQSSPQASQTPALSARSTLVLVPALVRTKAGDLIYTLTADDFVLTDDGVPQKLTLEEDSGGEPLALVVVIEIGGAGAREFNKYKLHCSSSGSHARIHRRERAPQSCCGHIR